MTSVAVSPVLFRSAGPLWCGVLVLMIGCGNPMGTVPADGQVVYQGKPLAGAMVMAVRNGGEKGPAALGSTDQEGRFVLQTSKYDGAVPGQYRVVVRKTNFDDLGIPDPLPEGTTLTDYMRAHNLIPKSLIPLKYDNENETPLRVTVSPAADQNHFELQLEGPPPRGTTP